MITLFFPYYQCGDAARQAEIDFCLRKNAENAIIGKLFIIIDDSCEPPVGTGKAEVIRVARRPTYRDWVELTEEHCRSGVSLLSNSDIFFEDTVSMLPDLLAAPKTFLALTRWELLSGQLSKHPNPRWSQDSWAIRADEKLPEHHKQLLEFPMGVPRCDNKVAYLFAIQGWKLFNPVGLIKSIHVHETQMRTYDKKLDDRILGGVAYVHPCKSLSEESTLDFEVWTKRSDNINRVAINKSMETWIREASETGTISHEPISTLIPLSPAIAGDLLEAMRLGENVYTKNANFHCIRYRDKVFFSNAYATGSRFSLDHKSYSACPALYNVAGLIPPVLATSVEEIGLKPVNQDDLNFWQYPCATEKQAYLNHLDVTVGKHVDLMSKVVNIYVPVPWATYVDKGAFPDAYLVRVKNHIELYRRLAADNGFQLRAHSVCQHIHWMRVVKTAEWLGITDFHLSHKDSSSERIQKDIGTRLRLHGWTLIAVNYEIADRSEGMERKPLRSRGLHASLIGAHMPHYRDASRIEVFDAAREWGRDDVLVDLGNEWHFNKIVYEEQVLSKEIETHHIDEHHERTFRYNATLCDTRFSLCPQGAGPNTLRLWESMAVGSIPVIFSDDLEILHQLDNEMSIKDNIVIWDKEIDRTLFEFLEKYCLDKGEVMSRNLIKSYDEVRKRVVF